MVELKVPIKNLETNYKTAGQGEPVLILHGWGGSSDSWTKVQEILSAKGFKVIVPDLPGFGKSQAPPAPWRREEYLSWLLDFLKSVKLDKFFLISHSFGGSLAIKLATNYPEMIRKLILCAPAGIKQRPGFKTQIILALSRAGNSVFSCSHFAGLKKFLKDIVYFFIWRRDYAKATGTMRQTFINVINENLLDEIPRIKAETLILWGDKDQAVPLGHAYIYKEKIASSKLIVLPDIGHSPNQEVPDKLAKIILNFLEQ